MLHSLPSPAVKIAAMFGGILRISVMGLYNLLFCSQHQILDRPPTPLDANCPVPQSPYVLQRRWNSIHNDLHIYYFNCWNLRNLELELHWKSVNLTEFVWIISGLGIKSFNSFVRLSKKAWEISTRTFQFKFTRLALQWGMIRYLPRD